MPARKKPSAAIALGKHCERGLRRLRHGVRDACAAAALLRDARRADTHTLARRAAGLEPPDMILCCRAEAEAAVEDCRRVLHAVAAGPLPPRRVWIVAASAAVAALRNAAGTTTPTAPGRPAAELHLVAHTSGCGATALAALRTAVAAAASGHVILCDSRATVCDDAIAWIAAILERHGRGSSGHGLAAVYGDDAVIDQRAACRAAITLDHKPDFSYASLLAGSCLGPIVAFERLGALAALDRLVARGLATDSPGESLYAVALEALRGHSHLDVAHVRHPLAVRPDAASGPEVDDTARIASATLEAAGVSAVVATHPHDASLHQFELQPRRAPHVSIVIPTKNAGALVASCIRDLRSDPGYDDFDVTVIDHESDEPALLDFLARESAAERLGVFPYRGPFNFAAMNNAAVRATRGSLLLFLNNDVDGFSPRWLAQLVATFELDDRVAAVGALLHYPEGDIQHAGVVLNAKRLCQHAHYNWPADALGYRGRIRRLQEFSAVTAACVLVRRDAFEAVGGFDERFPDDYNDIDLCLRLRAAGFAIVYQPHVRATHWEGRTRTAKETAKDVFVSRWRQAFAHDPFYHPHLAETDFRPDGLERFWRQRKAVALDALLANRHATVERLPPDVVPSHPPAAAA